MAVLLRNPGTVEDLAARARGCGWAAAIATQQAEAAELAQLRKDNKRLKEEVEVLRKASAFFARWATKT
jgi:transposase